MPALTNTTVRIDIPTSCGTLIFNKKGQILLCHVTGTNHWDIPKGMQEPGESTLHAAKRELMEETGLALDDAVFEEIGGVDYLKHKRLHLYRTRAPESLDSLAHLVCTSTFSHHVTGEAAPEMDGYCWASRDDIRSLCLLPMAQQLLSLVW
jgi:putative (di)nucleoside polyphosphate hydrolase